MSSHINKEKFNQKDEYFIEEGKGGFTKYLKAYKCEINNCGESFANSDELVDHLNSHL
jgi:hypothetical protein